MTGEEKANKNQTLPQKVLLRYGYELIKDPGEEGSQQEGGESKKALRPPSLAGPEIQKIKRGGETRDGR